MAVISYTAGDSEPGYEVQILDRDGEALDLTGCDHVEFRARLTTGNTTVTRTGAVTAASTGWCLFTWATTDLATVGIYNMQVRVYWTTTRWSSHPNNTYDALVVIREVES